MKEVLLQIFASDGKLSSSRVGHFIGLFAVIAFTGYDTIANGRLDFALAGLIIGGGTGGYAIHRTTGKETAEVKVDKNERVN